MNQSGLANSIRPAGAMFAGRGLAGLKTVVKAFSLERQPRVLAVRGRTVAKGEPTRLVVRN